MPADPRPKRRLSRREDNDYRFEGLHAREVELKRNRGEISCAECRRLKIKCDKQIPCQSCQRRGCASLCPNSSLETGQGTRFVLAATEHLHDRIAKMSARIRNLEDALEELNAKHSNDPHPLLRDDLASPTAEDDEDPASPEDAVMSPQNPDVIDSLGTLSISDDGNSRFFGPTGGSESLILTIDSMTRSDLPPRSEDSRSSKTPPQSQYFTRWFPFTPICPPAGLQAKIESYLPPITRTYQLCDKFFEELSWIYRGVPSSQIFEHVIPVIYGKSEILDQPPCPHNLSLLFSILAISALIEEGTEEAEHYHQLAREAVTLQSTLEEPSLETVQTLRLWSIYTGMTDGPDGSMELTWSLVTLAAHLSQTIGLHRDSSKWGLSPQVIERRRILFWDLFMVDAWQSLHTGRPPAFSRQFVDCGYPETPSDPVDAEFQTWLYRFTLECATVVAELTLSAETPSLATVMELDKKVQEFPMIMIGPLASMETAAATVSLSMRRFSMLQAKNALLLYIHRSFFAQAIIDNPENPLKSAYSQSFLAMYRAATNILRALQEVYTHWPKSCSRYWVMSTFAFSASVAFGVLVTRCPSSPLATQAMKELEQACLLFTKASTHSSRVAKSLPILLRLREKARTALANTRPQLDNLGRDQRPWITNLVEEEDELSIFAGRKYLLALPRPPSANRVDSASNEYNSPRESTSSEVPPSPASDLWTTEHLRTGYMSTPYTYHPPTVHPLAHFQPGPFCPPNLTWMPQHPPRQSVDHPLSSSSSSSSSTPFQNRTLAGMASREPEAHGAYGSPPLPRLRTQTQIAGERQVGQSQSGGFAAPQPPPLGQGSSNPRLQDRWASFLEGFGVEGVDLRKRF